VTGVRIQKKQGSVALKENSGQTLERGYSEGCKVKESCQIDKNDPPFIKEREKNLEDYRCQKSTRAVYRNTVTAQHKKKGETTTRKEGWRKRAGGILGPNEHTLTADRIAPISEGSLCTKNVKKTPSARGDVFSYFRHKSAQKTPSSWCQSKLVKHTPTLWGNHLEAYKRERKSEWNETDAMSAVLGKGGVKKGDSGVFIRIRIRADTVLGRGKRKKGVAWHYGGSEEGV